MTSITRPADSAEHDTAHMRRLAVDAEHLGIRVAIPVLALAGFVLTLWIMPVVLAIFALDNTVLESLVVPAAIGIAVLAAAAGDRMLKRRWPSGRALLFDQDQIVLQDRKRPEKRIRLNALSNLLTWRFTVARRGRIPKGYHCLAIQVLQDEQAVTIYAFVDPKKIDAVPELEAFVPLASRSVLKDDRLNMRVAGQQRRLLQAEDERWEDGAELSQEDFTVFWEFVLQQEMIRG